MGVGPVPVLLSGLGIFAHVSPGADSSVSFQSGFLVASLPLVLVLTVSLPAAGDATRPPDMPSRAQGLITAAAKPEVTPALAAIATDTLSTINDSLHLTPVPDRHAETRPPLESVARGLGFENVTVDRTASPLRIAYENRRFRHSADAYGWLERGGESFIAFERRLSMVAASIERAGNGPDAKFVVRYPSDAGYRQPPRGSVQDPISRTVDVLGGPLVAYDLGRVTEPIQFQYQNEVTLRWNPWPGSRLTGSVVFPVYNDFVPNELHPDLDNVRPGLLTVEQYAWIPRVALASGGFGVFADNRYGFSLGLTRPLWQGSLMLDAQTDFTGFVAFNTDAIDYSSLANWSTYGGLIYRPPFLDVSLRARYAQFLYGDHGTEVEMRRSFGDLELSFSLLKSGGLSIEAVKVTLPVPPLTRPTRMPVRVLPVERFPFSFRTDATPVGQQVTGTPSRDEFLRQLSMPALESNRYRYDRVQGRRPDRIPDPAPWASHSGMTGFIMTPWAGVQPDGNLELGFTNIPKKWAYNPEGIPRDVYHNEIYYASLGLLPRLEVGLRITRTPGFNPFGHIDPTSELSTDTDHQASFRIGLLEPRDRRPGLAFGVEDIQGTRRYNATYLVSGIPFSIFRVQNRFSLGYASTVFTASRHVLDGAFSAIEVSPWRAVAARFEYDTEKFNVGLGVELGFGLRIRAAALNMESLSAGVGWHHKL